MRCPVRVTAGAERDLAEISAYLQEREGSVLAERILEGLLATAGQLARFPERGTHPRELLALGIREFRQVLFQPYRITYAIRAGTVFIYLIADGRRDFQTLLERRLLRGD
jgi:toxin ParE1/3/4